MNNKSSPLLMSAGKRALLWTALFFVVMFLLTGGWLLQYALQSGPGDAGERVVVVIPRGAGLAGVSGILAEQDLVYPDIRFQILARILKRSTRLQAGEFSLTTGQKPLDLLKELSRSRPVQHPVTLPEGLRLTEMAALFAKGGWCDYDHFVALAADPDFIASLHLGEEMNSLEGYLYPDTYHLTRGQQGAEFLLRMMVRRFLTVWDSLESQRAGELSRHQVVILASIVEKETGAAPERPLIASVFANRLKRGMRLQSDPTVTYDLPDFSGRLSRKDLRTPTPYNTYVIPALPVGPICNPGKDALAAVLHPAESRYLYFVSKNNGTHYFSRNLKEHNRAVRKYQRKK